MMKQPLKLEDRYVGDEKTIVIATTSGLTGADKNPTTGSTFLCYDPARDVEGTADSGSTTTLVDATVLTEANAFFVGMPLIITSAADGREYRTEITGFVQATSTLTFYEIPVAVAEDDAYRIDGYPLLPQEAATMSGNEGSVQLTPSDALGNAGRRVLIYHTDFGTDSEDIRCEFDVLS